MGRGGGRRRRKRKGRGEERDNEKRELLTPNTYTPPTSRPLCDRCIICQARCDLHCCPAVSYPSAAAPCYTLQHNSYDTAVLIRYATNRATCHDHRFYVSVGASNVLYSDSDILILITRPWYLPI